jgi:lipoprotein-anchoring transpeptidase ErfK/SrfK
MPMHQAGAGAGNETVPTPPVVRITPAAGTAINPLTPIVVQAADARIASVMMTNIASGAVVTGSLSPDATRWTSSEVMGYGSTYRINATASGADGTPVQQTGIVHTLSPAAQTYPSLIPAPTTTQTFGVGQIIGVSFDRAVTDRAAAEKALSVTSNPPQTGSWYWMDSRTVHYRPQSYWQPGSTITVHANLFGTDLGGGVYGRTDRTATYHVHDSWIAKADGATDQMQILHNGALVTTMAMSLGSPGFPSHSGPHVISDKQPSITMDSCTYGICKGQPGYYREQVALDERISNDGEFVHSAPWSVKQQGSSNVSHGCVNLSPANAQWFYDHFSLGDVVEITNSGGPPLPVWDTYGDWELPWNQWKAGNTNTP